METVLSLYAAVCAGSAPIYGGIDVSMGPVLPFMEHCSHLWRRLGLSKSGKTLFCSVSRATHTCSIPMRAGITEMDRGMSAMVSALEAVVTFMDLVLTLMEAILTFKAAVLTFKAAVLTFKAA
eukprot:595894-Rhodomonas_salina.3